MKIRVGEALATAITSDVRYLAAIRDTCRARPSGYQYMKKYKRGYWDGYISLMKGFNKFPSGLVPMVVERLEQEGVAVELDYGNYVYQYNEVRPDDLIGVILRDYQVEAANTLLNVKRGVAKMATNSGKTEVMAALVNATGRERALAIVSSRDLLYQTAERFSERLGMHIGVVGDGSYKLSDVTVATIQTLSSRYAKMVQDLGKMKLLMVDECHHVSSNQMMNVLLSIYGKYRFGFSGTPLKHTDLADLKLIGATGPIVVDISNEYLIDEGYSAKPIIYMYVVEEDDEDIWDMDYQEAYQYLIVEDAERNETIARFADECIEDGKVVLVLVNRVEHGKILNDMIDDSIFVHGSDSTETRQGVLDLMRTAERGMFIASPIFDEGVDVPAVDAIILAAGGKGHIKLLQRIGRGLRKKEGENVLEVYDFIDDTNKYLFSHSEHRLEVYKREGFDTRLT